MRLPWRMWPTVLAGLLCGASLQIARHVTWGPWDGLWSAPLALLVAGALLAVRMRGSSRSAALLGALLGGGLALGLALWIHQDLRGERPDPGPEPQRYAPADGPAAAPAESGAQHPLRLLVWGDCRSGVTVQQKLARAIERRQPELAVGLGDLVGMARAYQFEIVARRFLDTGVAPLYVPGNHDLDPFGTLKPYAHVFGPPNWSRVRQGVLLLGLDSAAGVVDPRDVAWLEEQVALHKPAVRRTLLFVHHPLYTPEHQPEKPLPDDEATRRLLALVEREGIAVFCSHYHGYDVQRHGQVLQVTTGGAGARPEGDDPYHYVWVEVGDEVTFEQVVLAQQSEVSATMDRLLTFRDEAAYAGSVFELRSVLAAIGLAVFLGGLMAAGCRRRSPHSSSASSV